MEFGYTIPLQKHIKMELSPSKSAVESFFCWAIHMLTVQGRKAVLAMNCASRYCVLLYGMRAEDWTHLPWIIEREIRAAILREGLSEFESTRYFALGGPLKTCAAYGTDVVTGLNWAMQILLQHLPLLDGSRFSQPQAAHIINDEVYYAAELSKYGTPREYFLAEFRSL